MKKPTEIWHEIEGTITSPSGYRAGAVSAEIKAGSKKKDLAILYSETPASGAGLFTKNQVVAAPVVVSRKHLQQAQGHVRAIIVNSGNANACTGPTGLRDARQMTQFAAAALQMQTAETLVASTGTIGNTLPMIRIERAMPGLIQRLSGSHGEEFSDAILTTDTRRKVCVLRSARGKNPVTIAGTAKGSGMIHPQMATMLAFITTDAYLPPNLLHGSLKQAVAVSFNRITVDGDTSTNDSVFVMANGSNQNARISGVGAALDHFQEGLTRVCTSLARQIVRDGEGAKKLISITVSGSCSVLEAERMGRSIANSPLVKTAVAGADANWGRIICAAGYSGVSFDPDRVDIRLNGLLVCRGGRPASFDEKRASRLLKAADVQIDVLLHLGRSSATVWTCDLTEGYIKVNASYRS